MRRLPRRGFIARLLALATLPFVGKVAAALPAEAPRAPVVREWPSFMGCIENSIPYGDDLSQYDIDGEPSPYSEEGWVNPPEPDGVVVGSPSAHWASRDR
jgi:hypothetical protein